MDAAKRKIAQATAAELSELLDAVVARHAHLNPDWDICVLSVQRSKDRDQQLEETIRLLKSLKDSR